MNVNAYSIKTPRIDKLIWIHHDRYICYGPGLKETIFVQLHADALAGRNSHLYIAQIPLSNSIVNEHFVKWLKVIACN